MALTLPDVKRMVLGGLIIVMTASLVACDAGAPSEMAQEQEAQSEDLDTEAIEDAPEPTATNTPEPTATPFPEPTSTPTTTPTPEPDAVVRSGDDTEVNVRSGPGTAYDIVSTLQDGVEVTLLATNPDQTWVQIEAETEGDVQYWVSSDFLEFVGRDVSDLAVAENIPPEPVPPPAVVVDTPPEDVPSHANLIIVNNSAAPLQFVTVNGPDSTDWVFIDTPPGGQAEIPVATLRTYWIIIGPADGYGLDIKVVEDIYMTGDYVVYYP